MNLLAENDWQWIASIVVIYWFCKTVSSLIVQAFNGD